MEVQFYNIQDYQPGNSMQPAHTAVIDKCGKATVPADAASNVAPSASQTTNAASG